MTKYTSTALVLVLSGALVSSVAYARPLRAYDAPGYQARAQAGGIGEMTPHRAQALRECTDRANKLLQKDWGVRQLEVEGACMAEHGEPE